MPRFAGAILVIVTMLVTWPAAALDGRDITPQGWLRRTVLNLLHSDITADEVQAFLRQAFVRTDIDRTGISAATIETHRRIQRARQRAHFISQKFAWDLDGDGIITREELAVAFRAQALAEVRGRVSPPASETERAQLVAERLAALIAPVMKDDADDDGRLTLAEVTSSVDRWMAESDARLARLAPGARVPEAWLVPDGLDPSGDGVLTLAEFDAVVQAFFDTIDTNRDRRISAEEGAAFARASGDPARASSLAAEGERQTQELAARRNACGLPLLPNTGRAILVGASHGRGLSDVTLGDDSIAVGVGQITIDPGTEPLHLVLSSSAAQIWIVTGAVERVESVSASAHAATVTKIPLVGIVGLAPERVHIASEAGCIQLIGGDKGVPRDDEESRKAIRATEVLTGRRLDQVAAVSGLATLHLPSVRHDITSPFPGTIVSVRGSPGAAMWREVRQKRPSGLVRVDPALVVSRAGTRRLEVLPAEAGIAQLLDQGALVTIGYNQAITLKGSRPDVSNIVDIPSRFRIISKIRLPPGLAQAITMRFVLPRGVPEPEGDPGGNCIVSEETGKAVGRSTCPDDP